MESFEDRKRMKNEELSRGTGYNIKSFDMRFKDGLFDAVKDWVRWIFANEKSRDNSNEKEKKDPKTILKNIKEKIEKLIKEIENIQKKIVKTKLKIEKLKKDPTRAGELENQKDKLKNLQRRKINLLKKKIKLEETLKIAEKLSGKFGNEKSSPIKSVEERFSENTGDNSYYLTNAKAISAVYNFDNGELQAVVDMDGSPFVNPKTESELSIKSKSLRAKFPNYIKKAAEINRSRQNREPDGRER